MTLLKSITSFLRSTILFNTKLKYLKNYQKKYIHIALIGAASKTGKNTALLLKQNNHISKLHLYDDNTSVLGLGLELSHIPGGPIVTAFCEDQSLPDAIRNAHLVLMVSRIPRKLGNTREQMLATNALPVQRLCKAVSNINPEAFLAFTTNPINSIVPFASALLFKYNACSPCKIFGITHIDTARARALLAKTLNVNPRSINVPVIGGHSDDTIIPLFSNISPSHYRVKPCQADTLTRLVKKCGTEVLNYKLGNDSAVLVLAWSINEFVEKIIQALYGGCVVVNCYATNPHYGTRFFSGPTKVGSHGIIDTCINFQMSDFESKLLERAVPIIHRDVARGEEHVNVVETAPNL
ncbi:malate dehydrogenase-like [Pararge aegeria]|uniref:malate dehydrogenase-like n=1 Tax=Pararge aegeria TaxID=116150 RepID=UPI0019CFA413|nr:malate dehydrogenase-like [Pararge aegeria]